MLDADDYGVTIPSDTKLYQNYPNPFNPSTRIEFFIAEAGTVTLKLFNLLGEEIYTLADQFLERGFHSRTLDAADLSAGVYLYTLSAGNIRESKKLLVIK